MKLDSRRICTANMHAVNGSIFVSAASLMLELGLLRHNAKAKLLAPYTCDGTMKASVFEKWFEDKLLNCLPKGHVIIMDNAAFHKKVLQNIAGKYWQRLIFLPPYSPEYNPIEHT